MKQDIFIIKVGWSLAMKEIVFSVVNWGRSGQPCTDCVISHATSEEGFLIYFEAYHEVILRGRIRCVRWMQLAS